MSAIARCTRRAYAGETAPASAASWDAIKTEALSDASQRELLGLQKAVFDMREAVAREAYKGPEPDFAAMKKDTSMPEIVDEFEKAYKGVTKPDSQSPEIDALKQSFVGLEAEAKAHAQAAEKRIAELDLELKNVEEQRARLSTITMDEYFETNPELKKEIDEKIKNDKWFEV